MMLIWEKAETGVTERQRMRQCVGSVVGRVLQRRSGVKPREAVFRVTTRRGCPAQGLLEADCGRVWLGATARPGGSAFQQLCGRPVFSKGVKERAWFWCFSVVFPSPLLSSFPSPHIALHGGQVISPAVPSHHSSSPLFSCLLISLADTP